MVDFTPAEERAARLGPAERRLHHAILRAFPAFGGPPAAGWLAEQARAVGLDPDAALAALVEAESAGRYAAMRPEVTGRVLDQAAALRSGIRSFGGLLSGEDGGPCDAACCGEWVEGP